MERCCRQFKWFKQVLTRLCCCGVKNQDTTAQQQFSPCYSSLSWIRFFVLLFPTRLTWILLSHLDIPSLSMLRGILKTYPRNTASKMFPKCQYLLQSQQTNIYCFISHVERSWVHKRITFIHFYWTSFNRNIMFSSTLNWK